jgi:phosphoribosylanthranilate isomerase
MTRVKVCGITNLDDALAALDAGADMLGFNFYARSPRCVTAADARGIVERLPEGAACVGVFARGGRTRRARVRRRLGATPRRRVAGVLPRAGRA